MTTSKLAILITAAACLGIVGVFLPLNGGASYTLWDLHNQAEAYWIYAGLTGALIGGVAASLKPPMQLWHAMTAAIGFIVIGVKFRTGFFDLFTSGGIGGRLLGVSVAVGAVASGVAY